MRTPVLGGNATLYVSDFPAAVTFWTEAMGLRLRFRAGDDWAEVEAGKDLVIGLHPARPGRPRPGSVGAVQIGLVVEGPLETTLEVLRRRGVAVDPKVVRSPSDGFAFGSVRDPDGNEIYLWEKPAATTVRTRTSAKPGRAPRRPRTRR